MTPASLPRRGRTLSRATFVAVSTASVVALWACAVPPAGPSASATAAAAPAVTASASANTGATLYERLGGHDGVALIVGRLLDRTSTDPRTKRSFDGVRIAYLKNSLAAHLCVVTGGRDCGYDGETMVNAHADLKIPGSEFDAMVTMLREELDRAGIDPGAKNDLLHLLAPTRRAVVTAGVTR